MPNVFQFCPMSWWNPNFSHRKCVTFFGGFLKWLAPQKTIGFNTNMVQYALDDWGVPPWQNAAEALRSAFVEGAPGSVPVASRHGAMATVRPQRLLGWRKACWCSDFTEGDWMRLVVVYYSLLILEFGGSMSFSSFVGMVLVLLGYQ